MDSPAEVPADVRAEVRDLVQDLLRRKGVADAPADGDSLVASGLLDSVDLLEVVDLLEARWSVDFTARAFDPLELDTIEAIAARAAEGTP